MLDNDDVIDTLNDLIEASKEGEAGYRQSADYATDPQLNLFFIRRSAEAATRVRELQEMVGSLGGHPVDSLSIGGTLHLRWNDLKTALLQNDNLAVIDETERDAEMVSSAYLDALALDLPVEVEILLSRQYEEAQHNQLAVKQLKQRFQAETLTDQI